MIGGFTMDSVVGARRSLVTSLRRFLVGPYQDENEEQLQAGVTNDKGKPNIRQFPSDLYHTGTLTPSGTLIDDEEAEQERDDGDIDTGAGDGILALANASQQSAIGLTARIGKDCSSLVVKFSWGEYQLIARTVEGEWIDYDVESKTPNLELAWRRKQTAIELPLHVRELPEKGKKIELGEFEEIKAFAKARRTGDTTAITIAIVNTRQIEKSWTPEDRRVYQCKIELCSPEGQGIFLPSQSPPNPEDYEAWNYELLYRNAGEFGIGHGCGVMWPDSHESRVSRIWTEWLPEAEVFKASASIEQLKGSKIFELATLSRYDDRQSICEELEAIPKAYLAWIAKQEEDIQQEFGDESGESRSLLAAAQRNLSICREQSARISSGIAALKETDMLWRAFVLANTAMRMAMIRSRPDAQGEPAWFPFQLAFVLLSMQSTVDHTHSERELLDLIWFPTGGGKTEAYLGLSCVVMFYRRLAADGQESGSGTAVLTRYTLRLLTMQQFERTARVICACESVRRTLDDELGGEPFSIGLYVGKPATPNKLGEAQELIDKRGAESNQTTLPTKVCPWCSTKLKYENQLVQNGRLITRCTGKGCEFAEGIPFTCIDEEIYSHPPSFLVGTVDKFAQITWEPASGAILGNPGLKIPPPNLIIQDELHLISDSLGSITGLYETAIDKICEFRGAIPKIIGSTATIKRAEEQIAKLFCRAAMQFPPSGICQTDSFFYTEDTTIPGRLYVGIHAQGRSPKHTLPRVIALLKQFCGSIEDDDARDIFHTLVCYFNSLRELGGALVLAEDDVPRYLAALEKGGYLPEGSTEQSVQPVKELTSSLSTDEINSILEELKVKISDDHEEGDPIGLVLSTNMISVGVDVDRLGAMVVNGQPKTTSEYIQASSRVGRPRGSAGLVATVYNWTRPRDRSHYEKFVGYHRAFYKHVEALTVTPFSARARDRALHSVLFAICRHTIPELYHQTSAGGILSEGVKASVEAIMEGICERIAKIDSAEAEDTRDQLTELLSAWIVEAEDESRDELYWNDWGVTRNAPPRPLMKSSEEKKGALVTPLSMRDVDAQSPVRLLHRKDIGVADE
jgi:hypothetical protein